MPFTIHGTDKTQKIASETDCAGSRRTKPPGSQENSSTTVVAHSLRAEGHDASEDGTGRGVPLTAMCLNAGGMGRIDGESETMIPVAMNLRGREGGAMPELDDVASLRAANGGSSRSYVFDTSRNKGIMALEESDASTQEANAIETLRRVRDSLGEEAFAEWGLGILDSLQRPEILQQAVHGGVIRPAAFSKSWVVCCACASPQNLPQGALQSLREAQGDRRSPSGREPSEQLARELGAYLSGLSHPGAQAERFMRDLWQAAEGLGLLRQALSAVQEIRRPKNVQAQPAHPTLAVRRLTVTECEFLQGFPRGYLDITYRGKPAADGPKYKALGNSWAVPVVRWIGARMAAAQGRLFA